MASLGTTYPSIRIFMIASNGALITRSSPDFPSPQEFAAFHEIRHLRKVLAWEPTGVWLPDTPEDRFMRCGVAIDAGRQLRINARALLDEWARGPTGIGALAATPTPTVIAAAQPGPRKPPRTVIVQDWLREVATSDEGRRKLADDAWAATMAACKGM